NVVFQGTQRIGALNIGAPGGVTLPSGSNEVLTATALNIVGNGKLNLTTNGLIIDYTGASPIAQLQSLITRGYNGGTWNGTGIATTSGNATTCALGFGEASQVAPGGSFGGQPVDATAVVVKFTSFGDANLDGTVDTLDFNSFAANFGRSGKFWTQGDFNYDGIVDTLDFNALATTFRRSVAPAAVTSASAQSQSTTSAAPPSWRFSEIRVETRPAACC